MVFLLWLYVSCAQRKGPVISYEKKIINIGNLQFKEVHSGKILIRNIGDEVMKILKVEADCACTVTEIEKQEISPNDSTYIHFNIKPARDGLIQQSIFIDNNSINESRVLLLIRAKVSSPVPKEKMAL